jgi:hypothetical protein
MTFLNGAFYTQFAEFSMVHTSFSKLRSYMENTQVSKTAEVSRQDAPNGIWVAYVNFYNIWVLRQG